MFSAGSGGVPQKRTHRCCYIQLELLEILHLLDKTTLTVAPRSKEIEYCVLLPDAPPCTLWFATMPALASTKPQEGMQRGSELPRPSTWQPLVPLGMDSSKRVPYKLQMLSPHVTNLPGKIGVSHFYVTCR